MSPPRVAAMRALLGSIWDLDDEGLLTLDAHDRIVTVCLRAIGREMHRGRLERAESAYQKRGGA